MARYRNVIGGLCKKKRHLLTAENTRAEASEYSAQEVDHLFCLDCERAGVRERKKKERAELQRIRAEARAKYG